MIGKPSSEGEHLLSLRHQRTPMASLTSVQDTVEPGRNEGSTALSGTDSLPVSSAASEGTVQQYRVYKRRWFGLIQLVLLNIVLSWGVCD